MPSPKSFDDNPGQPRGRGRGRGPSSLPETDVSSSSAPSGTNVDDSPKVPGASADDSGPGKGRGRSKGDGKGRGREGNPSRAGSDDGLNPVEVVSRGDGSFQATATPGRDLLSGVTTDAAVFFTWNSLSDSLLKGSRRSVLIDKVIGFTSGVDGIDVPSSINAEAILAISSLSGRTEKLVAGQINAKGVGADRFSANSVAAFTCKGFDGTYLVLNDNRNGYQQNSDGLIFLEGYDIGKNGAIAIY